MSSSVLHWNAGVSPDDLRTVISVSFVSTRSISR